MKQYLNNKISSKTFKMMRKALHLNQGQLATLLGVSIKTIQRVEISKNDIDGPMVILLTMLFLDSSLSNKYEIEEQKYQIRFLYKYMDVITSVIDVDNNNQKIHVKNLTDNIYYLPFGANKNPTYEDYLALLEDRVFSKNRDDMELELKRLNLPFYDPYLIVLKTKGKVEGDFFSLEVMEDD